MATKVQRFFQKKYVKISLIILSIFVIVITALYIWFVNNADRLLIELVSENSGGKLKLQLSRASFDLFTNEVKIHKAKIFTVSTQQQQISYQVSFQKVALTTNSLWSVFFKNALQIKKIKLYDPVIEVFRNKKDNTVDTTNNLSLSFELGKLYNAAKTTIVALNTHSISLFNARIILNNNSGTNKQPLIFSNIFFTIKKLNKGLDDGETYLEKNNIIFNSSNQEINFTDGIHKISFKKLELQNARNIILDSCTIIALPSKESKSNYHIQFKKLALIGVDFETLYLYNHIKADSVYCQSPIASLNFNTVTSDTSRLNKGLPDISKILKVFTGNIDIKFLGVTNAAIRLTVTGKKIQSELHNGKLNFQIKGLRINPDSSKLVSVASFDMLIKGYRLYNKDSSSVFSFDSVRFANNKLLLNNFSIHTNSGINKIRNFRDYTMPYFELRGVDWPELIFNQDLSADEAILVNPTINFKKNEKLEISKRSLILSSRNNFDDFMNIGKLAIVNGNVDIQWEENKSLTLQGFNLEMAGNNIADYKNVKFQNNIQSLFFEKGHLTLGDINADLKNITFKKNNQVHADELEIKNESGLSTKLEDVAINNVNVEKNTGTVIIDGLQWTGGNISINQKHPLPSRTGKSSLLFKNVSGKNTQLEFANKEMNLHGFITSIDAETLERAANNQLSALNFKINGKEIKFSNATIQMQSSNFMLSDNLLQFEKSYLEKKGYAGTLVMDFPSLRISGNINDLLANNFNIKNIFLINPKINFKKQVNTSLQKQKNTTYNPVKIEHVIMQEPEIDLQFGKGLPGKIFNLPFSKGSEIKGDDIEILPAGTKINSLIVDTKTAAFSDNGKNFCADETLHAKLSKIDIRTSGDSVGWQAIINKLDVKNGSGFVFKLKQNQLFLKDISVSELPATSVTINNLAELLEAGKSSIIGTSELKYFTNNSLWQLNNVSYNSGLHELTSASISFRPVLSRDAFIAAHPYQVDYLNFTSDNTKIYGIDLNSYFNGKAISITKATISKPVLSVYRDKLPPFPGNSKKPLFTEKIKNIAIPVTINQIDVDDGKVSYTERNEKNRLEGNLSLTHLNGTIANINNHDHQRADSLSLNFTGKLQNDPAFGLKLKESYVDPLSGFTMTLKIDPASVLFLNPLLEPLSNVKFIAGHINKFEMKASGNDNAASGELKFYYENLHINLIKNGGLQKTGFLKKRESDLVNFFLIKNNNTSRTGLIYFKRLKDRSFFNYMNKIIFSGVVTSVGAKSNSSYKKSISDDDNSQ